MAAQKFTNFDKFFLMHADMPAVTKQSNETVSTEVQDNEATRAILYGKKTK